MQVWFTCRVRLTLKLTLTLTQQAGHMQVGLAKLARQLALRARLVSDHAAGTAAGG
jgi:hypothetical protein